MKEDISKKEIDLLEKIKKRMSKQLTKFKQDGYFRPFS